MDRKAVDRRQGDSLNEQIYQEAGEWFLEFRDGEPSAETRSDFDLWVRRSPEHLAAYLEIAAIWNEAPTLASPEKSTLIERAAQDAANVVALGFASDLPAAAGEARPKNRLYTQHRAIAAAILVLGVLAAWWYGSLSQSIYSTGIGEQRIIALKDGSHVTLNSRSKIRVHYTEGERGIELVEGQALFSVARDPTRPFVVGSGDARVRAVGTQFDVYRKSSGTVVTVVEGQVAIGNDAVSPVRPEPGRSEEASPQPVLISAGQQLVVTRSEIKKPVAANVSNVTAWTQQQLAFDAASLSDVAEEFNRYNERQLRIRDRDAFEFRISGVFSSSDPAGLIRFLRDRPGIRVIESASEIVVERIDSAESEKKPYQNREPHAL